MGDMFTVTAPVVSFNGDLAGLVFRDGTATADSDKDGRALAYCRRHGYGVTPAESGDSMADESAGDARPKTTDNKPDWVAYAVTQGADEAEAEAMTKAELIAKYGTKGSTDE